MERETGKINVLTENLDRHVTGFTWHPDSKRIAFTIEDRGRQHAQLIPVTGGGTRASTQGASHVDDLQFTADGKTLVYTEVSRLQPHRDLSRPQQRRRARPAHAGSTTTSSPPTTCASWRSSPSPAPKARRSTPFSSSRRL